ncbi:Dak1 domain-containing protein [Mycena albidolilacea]|uniref:Dak1 domain-containing protein n=1 Tax=Mycena albidolilacea TaxID=1033008 RepID=A0AAD6ZNW7_9AGAR|nr:Dak1 domain-containing protein [Mycena albidolilacea]
MPPNPDFTSEFEGGTTCRSRPCANPCMPQPPTMGSLFFAALVSDGSKWYSSPSWTAPRSHSSVEVARAMSRHMRAFIGPQDSDPSQVCLAAEQYAAEHTEKSDKVKFLVVGDDVGVGKTQGGIVGRSSRLGLTRAEGLGVVLVYKIAGALAAEGATLDEVHSIVQWVAGRIGTIGVGLEHCHFPGTALPLSSLSPTEIEIGLGGVVHAVWEELHKHQIGMSRVLAGMFMSQHARLLPLAAPPPARGRSRPQAERPILSLLDAPAKTPGWKWASGAPPVTPTPLAPPATATKKGGSASSIGAPLVAAEPEITCMDTIAGNGDCGLEF